MFLHRRVFCIKGQLRTVERPWFELEIKLGIVPFDPVCRGGKKSSKNGNVLTKVAGGGLLSLRVQPLQV